VTETRLTGLLIKTGSIPTNAIVNFAGAVTASLPIGTVSSSTQVTALLPGGAISSSTQVNYTELQNIPSGIASSSAQVKAYLPTDSVSSSIQVTAFLPTGTVSASNQVSYTGLSNIPTGIVSSSGQVTTLLPTGTVSSSAQIPVRTFTVTNSGASAYLIDGASNPTLTLIRGFTYNFSVNASGHPFWIQTVAGAYSSGNIYSTGITNGGAAVGTITFTVPYDAPNTLYYVCQFHSSMAGTINIKDVQPSGLVSSSGQITLSDISGTTFSNNNFTFPLNVNINGVLTATSQSVSYVSSSQLNVGSNDIILNTTEQLRFGGLTIFDSGSAGQSGSLFWDSLHNVWLYVHAGTSNTSSILITGPENTGTLGSEQFLTPNLLPKAGTLGDHIVDSQISDNGTTVGMTGNLVVTGSVTANSSVLRGSTSGTVTVQAASTAGTTTITLPATTGTVVTTGDTSTVTNTMLAGSIANNKLANSTISGISLGSNLATLTIGSGLTGTSYNGSTAVTISISNGAITNAMLANSTISGVALGSNLATLTMNVSGTGLSGNTTYNGSGATTFTVTSNATSANTAGAIVARDGSGNFSAGTVTATLSGNASTATSAAAWTTARTITIGSTGKSVDGSGNVSWTLSEIGAYSNTNPSGYTTNTGTVTSVSGTGTASGLSLSGTVTTSGNITLSGTVNSLAAGTYSISISGNAATATTAGSITSQANSATITADTAASANTIVRRDASGHITGAYIFGSYFNASAGNSENPTIGQIWTQNTSDNYLRKSTPAHLISQLGLITTSNYSSYALPLSGGTMTGAISTPSGTSIYLGSQNVSTSGRIVINWHTDSDYNYLIGKRAGAWTQPMDIAFYTGLRYHAHQSYNGHIFYVSGYDGGEAFSVGRGDSNVRVNNTLFIGGNTALHAGNYSSYAIPVSGGINMSGGFGLNDQRLYLRTNGDTNHYIWNAADDWEELVFYTGTGFRIAGSNGSSYATVTTNGIACGTITSTYYNSGDGLFLFRYGSNSGVTRHINLSNSTTDPSAASVDSGISWGQRSDNQAYYLVYCTQENYNGNYNKLTLNWHTGIRIGAATTYGGTTFYDNSLNITSTILFSVGRGDSNVRTSNTFYAGGDVVAYSSDIRLKENIKPIDNAIDKIMKLNGVYYTWKDMVTDVGFTPLQKDEVGVLAQEVQEVLPEVVTAAPFDCEIDPPTGKTQSKSGQNYLTVKYEKLVPLLIEAIKEQQTTIQQLNSRIDALESK
jgi:hypothetical protein